jgi:plastocyanin
MISSRRHVLRIGGGFLASLAAPRLAGFGAAGAAPTVEIRMRGNVDGSHVWFDPVGIRVQPGQTIRWTNLDPGNSHTATAYHPDNFERALRIPKGASPWNSDYLLPNETFSITPSVEGVYDFYCIPHEHAGMVGRIIVGRPDNSWAERLSTGAEGTAPIPEVALRALPPVEEIMRQGSVRRT